MKPTPRLLRRTILVAAVVAAAGFLSTIDAKSSREPAVERIQNAAMFGGLAVVALGSLVAWVLRTSKG